MIKLKKFEDFIFNNNIKELITVDDIIECIKKDGVIYSDIINNYPDNEVDAPIRPLNIDNDGLITVDINGLEYTIDIKNVKSIEL